MVGATIASMMATESSRMVRSAAPIGPMGDRTVSPQPPSEASTVRMTMERRTEMIMARPLREPPAGYHRPNRFQRGLRLKVPFRVGGPRNLPSRSALLQGE